MNYNMSNTTASFFVLLALLLSTPLSAQSTLNVPSTSYPTIQSAINAAVTGDTVIVAAGTYFENLVWGGQDITVQGAGVGQSIIDGGQIAPCLRFDRESNLSSIVDGFTLTNGLGAPTHNGMFFITSGGGVHMIKSALGFPEATIRNCEISFCKGEWAAAVNLIHTNNVKFENVHFHDNTLSPTGAATSLTILIMMTSTSVEFTGCRFENNGGYAVIAAGDATLALADCLFESNNSNGSVFSATTSKPVSIKRCIFQNNVCLNVQSASCIGIGSGGEFGIPVEVVDCLMSGNVGGAVCVGISAPTSSEIRNLTVVDNQLGVAGGGVFTGLTLNLWNVISWGNLDIAGNLPPLQYTWPGNLLIANACIVEGGILGSGSVTTSDPVFVDPINGDYRLLPGSPAVDVGSALGVDLTDFDVDGNPRNLGLGVDIGAYESHTIAHHPASDGRVGAGQGGPFDILLINGSSGGSFRTVTVPIGTASVVEMVQPPSSVAPLDFSIFGLLGEATLGTIWNVPLGIGDMGFAPAPVAPFLQPYLFTYASSVGPIQGVVPFLPTSMTPWNSGFGPPIPFPLTLTLQGVVADANNVFTPTNLIIFKVE